MDESSKKSDELDKSDLDVDSDELPSEDELEGSDLEKYSSGTFISLEQKNYLHFRTENKQ